MNTHVEKHIQQDIKIMMRLRRVIEAINHTERDVGFIPDSALALRKELADIGVEMAESTHQLLEAFPGKE